MPANSAMSQQLLEDIQWTADGLVPVIAQEAASGTVLMLAWMNREALNLTISTGDVVYWSRTRKQLWRKGERSGNVQRVREIRLDCDGDVLLIEIEQIGDVACHTGRHRCFFRRFRDGRWVVTDPIVKNPRDMYGK